MARHIAIVVAIVLLLPLLLLTGAVLLVQSQWGERWLEGQVSSRIHRQVQIDGKNGSPLNVFEFRDLPPGLYDMADVLGLR